MAGASVWAFVHRIIFLVGENVVQAASFPASFVVPVATLEALELALVAVVSLLAQAGCTSIPRLSTYLFRLFAFPSIDVLANEVKIFFIKLRLFFALLTSLAFFAFALLVRVTGVFLVLFIFVYDEALTDLSRGSTLATWFTLRCLCMRCVFSYLGSLLFIIVVIFFLARIIQMSAGTSSLPFLGLAGLFIEGLVVFVAIHLGLPHDQVSHRVAHLGGSSRQQQRPSRWLMFCC